MSKQLPPELVDGILTLVGAIIGWFTKWLQSKKKIEQLKNDKEYLVDKLTKKQQ